MRALASLSAICIALLLACHVAHAEDDDDQEVGQELGAVLAWRLSPEAVEEWCRVPDPEGIAVRQKALANWLKVNDSRIKSVDARVAEVVPLLFAHSDHKETVDSVHAQVKDLLHESLFEGKNADDIKAACKAEADPASERWTSNGMPNVAISLAALYDWQTRRSAK